MSQQGLLDVTAEPEVVYGQEKPENFPESCTIQLGGGLGGWAVR